MLSLDSDQSEAALRRFDERVRKGLGPEAEVDYVLEPKLDGASIELVYPRGACPGLDPRRRPRGEGVTANVRTIPAVPLRLRDRQRPVPPFLAVRGEVIMRVRDFEKLNERLLAEGKEPFANPRNAAAGALRQLDPQITAARPLDLYAYDILLAEGFPETTQGEVLAALRDWGFRVNELTQRAATADEILAYHGELERRRDDLGYEIDGVVIKLDDLPARERLGWTSRHPRWAFAFKFPPRKEVTKCCRSPQRRPHRGGDAGRADAAGRDRRRDRLPRHPAQPRGGGAQGHARGGPGARAARRRRHPAGHRAARGGGGGRPGDERAPVWRMPAECPSCGTPLVERGPFTVCPNGFGCPAQLAGRIVHFASRDALDIDGLGDETAKLFVTAGLVRQLPDLFGLGVEQLLPLEGFAQKSAEKLVEAIAKAAHAELPRFLYGLGIPEVGVAVARDLARHFGTFAGLREASAERLQEVPGVGPRMAEQITAFFAEPGNAAVLDELLARMKLKEGPPAARRRRLRRLRRPWRGRSSSSPGACRD